MINKKQEQAFIKAIKDLRDSVSNEQAQAVAILYPSWREDAIYDKGERLQYNDKLYIVNEEFLFTELGFETDNLTHIITYDYEKL